MNPKKVVLPLGTYVNTPYLHYYLRYNYMFRLLTIATFRLYMNPKKVVLPLGSNVNTPLPSNKISCVRQEHTLHSNKPTLLL